MSFATYRNLRFAFQTLSANAFRQVCTDQGLNEKQRKALVSSFRANGFRSF